MNMKNVILSILAFGLFGVGCSNPQPKTMQYDEPFDKIYSYASENDKAFCIILVDSTQRPSQKYLLNLKNQNIALTDDAYCNIVDINNSSNEWYMKWLCPLSIPLTCVFSTDGTLLDLIPGATKETLLYTKQAISNKEMTKFHYPNRFNLSKSEIVPLLNQILKSKIELDQGLYESTALNNSIDSLEYPYPYYLRIIGELLDNDTIESKLAAKSMVELENPFYLEQFKNEFIVARKILDPNFDVNDEPNIRIDKSVISLSDCRQNESHPFTISICNDGKKPLEVAKIFKNCSCLSQMDYTEEFVIAPKDSVIVRFKFKPDQQGEATRDIFITSNAINKPIIYVKVLANTL